MTKAFSMRQVAAVLPVAALAFAVAATLARPALGQSTSVGSLTVVDGTVAMAVEDDFLRGRAMRRYFLDQAGSQGRYELGLTPHQARTVQPGMRVRVTGSLAGRMLTADPADHAVVALEAPDLTAAAPLAVRKVLVLLVDITDANLVTHSVSATCDGSSDMTAASTFGFNTAGASVNGCYQDSSFGQLGVGGASYPGTDLDVQRVTITDTVTACDYTSWGSKADAAATNLASYQHRVYVVPADVSCGWAGVAYVKSCPGPYCQSWVKAYPSQPCGYVDAIAHELGHNIGMMHASSDTNNDDSIDCEYCDDSDFMGYAEGSLRTLNGPHKVQMGWVSGSGIVDATPGGQFTLAPLGQPGAPWPQVATIIPSRGSPYYLSYRTASGYDEFLPGTTYSSGLVGEISIHRWPGGPTNTLFVTSLADGETFSDPANSLSIVQNSHSGSGVTFTVQHSPPPGGVDLVETAVGKPPAVAVPGRSFSATDTVKNQGTAAVGASVTRYYLSAGPQKSAGAVLLSGSRSISSLAAGEASSGSATVTIPSSIPLGTYYLLACSDALNAVGETNETNNCLASPAKVKVTRPTSWTRP